MKHIALLSLLALGCVLVHGAPVEQAALEQGSCEDAQVKFTAGLALNKINQDRSEGYILAQHRVSNVHMKTHAETGVVFYMTIDVVETNCSVLSRKDWKTCEVRPTHNTPVYGQCKVAIYINRPQRVARLYKYSCTIRPVPASKVSEICPDCPSHISKDNAEVQKALALSMEKFNKEGGVTKRFVPLKIERATAGMAMSMYYNVEYSIQETTCASTAAATDDCPPMSCEFAHKGFCKGSLFYSPTGDPDVSVECEVYEPEAAEREKILHEKDEDHAHTDSATHNHNHDHAHAVDAAHPHDHVHDHTKSHGAHDATHKHAPNSEHHHTHQHGAGSGHSHSHAHDHGHGHDHVHSHHAKAHDHSTDVPNQHHNYKHTGDAHTHEHDHEIALDHDHKHTHMHVHEHHHHHHDHSHHDHDHPMGMVTVLPAMDQPMTLPSFPDVPAAGPEVGVPLVLKEDPQIPGVMEPSIDPFPTTISGQCSPPPAGTTLAEKAFTEDPMFLPA